jgi:hypothetical protein
VPLLRDRGFALFAALAALLLSVEWGVTRSAAFARGGPLPTAVFFDVMVVLPLLYFIAVLRPKKRALVEVGPVVGVGAAVVGVLLAGRAETRLLVQGAGVVAEVTVLALLVRRLHGATRDIRGAGQGNMAASGDLLIRLHGVKDPLMRVLGLELAVAYYAAQALPFARRAPRAIEGRSFTTSEKSGAFGLLLALGFVAAVEGVALHLVLAAWSTRAAWVASALNAYALVWIVAAHQAARLRPVVVTATHLQVRASLLWTADVPRNTIAKVEAIAQLERAPGVLRASFGTAPCMLVTLSAPLTAHGLAGLTKQVTRIALYVDEPEALRAALATA